MTKNFTVGATPPLIGHVAAERFAAKLHKRQPLSEGGLKAVLNMPSHKKTYSAYQDIVREGDRTTHCCIIETGTVSRYRTLGGGARQILSFHTVGDMIDLQSALIMVSDHGIRTHTPTVVSLVPHDTVLNIAAHYPDVARALWFDTLVDAGIFREWTVNVGRRSARQRTAHLLLEFAYRSKMADLMIDDDTFELPISQADLSDALGITSVHLNRTLQWLRGARYIRTHSRQVSIENRQAMVMLAGFDPAYLHPEGPRTTGDAPG